jgi:hypothetical protein
MLAMNDQPIALTTTTTEAAALAELVAWSGNCPVWQRDALRRLCAQDQLTEEDLNALTTMCKAGGQGAVSLTREHVRDPAAGSETVTLRAMHDVHHVNALAAGERLTFDKTGVTIIYGDNGSGKSGYARVLKRVCRARLARDESILPNIYSSVIGTPTAVIDFSVNGQNRATTWMLERAADPLLSAVSVFDCRTANVHVDQTNNVAYTPLPLKMLASLAQVCQDVKQRINNEIKALQQQTPASISKPKCPPNTKVGRIIVELSASTKPDTVTALATLSEAEKTRLAVLNADLASDPVRTARQLQTSKKTIDTLIIRLQRLAAGLADNKVDELISAHRDWKAAQTASLAASSVLFSDDPLPDIGSDGWRALWEAARAYSQTAAYPERAFPVTDDEARCVLCQQELGPPATDRLNRFEAFVKDQSKRREGTARAVYELLRQGIRELLVLEVQRVADLAFIRDQIDDASLANTLRRSVVAALWRRRHILRNHVDHHDRLPPPLIPFPLDALSLHSRDLDNARDRTFCRG